MCLLAVSIFAWSACSLASASCPILAFRAQQRHEEQDGGEEQPVDWTQTPYDAALARETRAGKALEGCLDRSQGAPGRTVDERCDAERKAFVAAGDAVRKAIADEIAAILDAPEFRESLNRLQENTSRLNTYNACLRAKHWFQFWKRCNRWTGGGGRDRGGGGGARMKRCNRWT